MADQDAPMRPTMVERLQSRIEELERDVPPVDTRVPADPNQAMAMLKDVLMGKARFPTNVDLMPTPIDGYWQVNLQWPGDGPAFTVSVDWAAVRAVEIGRRGPDNTPVVEYHETGYVSPLASFLGDL